MSGTAATLRDRLRRIAAVKEASAAADTRLHLELDPGERLAITLAHCDAHIDGFADRDESDADPESDTWARVRQHLSGP